MLLSELVKKEVLQAVPNVSVCWLQPPLGSMLCTPGLIEPRGPPEPHKMTNGSNKVELKSLVRHPDFGMERKIVPGSGKQKKGGAGSDR